MAASARATERETVMKERVSATEHPVVQSPARQNALGIDRAAWDALLSELGEKPYRTDQILKWLHHRFVTSRS